MTLPSHLIYFSDENPGYTRKRWGRGFRYFNPDQKPLSDKVELKRIKALVIPPAWKKVWISPKVNSHLQCTGYDVKERKQYIYHDDWLLYRQEKKFEYLKEFGVLLPDIREHYHQQIRRKGWPREKVLSLILYMLDHYYFRIGNEQYARENGTYGVTTLRRRHVESNDRELMLNYTAKSGKKREVHIDDPKIARLVHQMSELPGYEIFRYQDDDGKFTDIDSSDVNAYLLNLTGQPFTAKNFRTWGGTRLAIEKYPEALQALKENPRLEFEPTLVRLVAEVLGNTVSVCREYYIHPTVLGFLNKQHPAPLDQGKSIHQLLSPEEECMLRILNQQNL